jgi:hypothetical protein
MTSARAELPPGHERPHPLRCDPARADYGEIVSRHTKALDAGRDTYVDPATGYEVWTARFLWDHGFCCEAGCRHCPFLPR